MSKENNSTKNAENASTASAVDSRVIMGLRIDKQLYIQLKKIAEESNRSMNGQAAHFIKKGIEEYIRLSRAYELSVSNTDGISVSTPTIKFAE